MMLQTLDMFDQRCAARHNLPDFPSTRYQGSKRKLLGFMSEVLMKYRFSSVLDLYSGTATVSLLFRHMGKLVTANDYLLYNRTVASFMLGVNGKRFDWDRAHDNIDRLFECRNDAANLVESGFKDVYFLSDENAQIDAFCSNLQSIEEGLQSYLMVYLMGQAMLMKRPYNLFHRANLSMRTTDVKRSFGNAKTWEKAFSTHMKTLLRRLRLFPFDGPEGVATSINSSDLSSFESEPDLIYLDPPYLNRKAQPVDYGTFYHFLDGLVDYSLFGKPDLSRLHRPIRTLKSRWATLEGGLEELAGVMERWPDALLAMSYRGDGQPSIDAIRGLLSRNGYTVDDHVSTSYKYVLSDTRNTEEHLIVARR